MPSARSLTLSHALGKHWLMIDSEPKLFEKFPHLPMVTTSNHKPLGCLLSGWTFNKPELVPRVGTLEQTNQTHFPLPPLPRQFHRCRGCQCAVCPQLTRHAVIHSRTNKSVHKINLHLTCVTTGVVYILSCHLCGKQYVGQTGYHMCKHFSGHTVGMHSHARANLYTAIFITITDTPHLTSTLLSWRGTWTRMSDSRGSWN